MNPIVLSALGNHLWQSTVVTVLAGLLALMLKKQSACVRYWVWFTASVKFLVPFSALIVLGSAMRWPVAKPIVTPHSVVLVATEITEPFVSLSVIKESTDATIGGYVPAALFIAWLVGFVTVPALWVRSWFRMRAIIRGASPLVIPPNTLAMASPALLEPSVFGAFRPVLVVPHDIQERLSEEQLRSVVAHEMCHIRRRDNLLCSVHMTVAAIFWFYPVVWWLGTRLLAERERACDEQVVRQGCDAHVYAEGILKICKFYLESPLRCASGVLSGANLQRRIEVIISGSALHKLNFGRMLLLAACGIGALALPFVVGMARPFPQSQAVIRPEDTRKFEVASIKSDPGCTARPRTGVTVSPGRLTLECITLQELVENAYGVWADAGNPNPKHPDVRGGPSWVNADHYTIVGTAPDNPSRGEMNGPMLRNLLEERFALKVHHDSEVVPVYALTLANGRVKPEPAQDGRCVRSNPTQMPPPPAPGEAPLPVCGRPIPSPKGGRNVAFDVLGISIADFADALLSRLLNRVVIDKTGETGFFDLHFEFTPNDATPLGGPPLPVAPAGDNDVSIFTALEQQLGLKLESAKAPVAVLVIDSVSKPSEN